MSSNQRTLNDVISKHFPLAALSMHVTMPAFPSPHLCALSTYDLPNLHAFLLHRHLCQELPNVLFACLLLRGLCLGAALRDGLLIVRIPWHGRAREVGRLWWGVGGWGESRPIGPLELIGDDDAVIREEPFKKSRASSKKLHNPAVGPHLEQYCLAVYSLATRAGGYKCSATRTRGRSRGASIAVAPCVAPR